MGSFITQRVASIAPHRVERLVLIGSTVSTVATLEELKAEVEELDEPLSEAFAVEFQASTIHRPLADGFFKRAVSETKKVLGHALHWEQPARFAADLNAFVRQG